MRSVRRALLVLFAGLALVACAAPTRVTPSTEPKPRAERPTYTLGEKWIRSDGAYELIRIENDRYIFSAGPGQEVHLTKDLAVARFQRGTWVTEFIPPPVLSWPLEVGKWGTSGGTLHAPNYPPGTTGRGTTFTWSVDAYEDVRVPAGTFRAFRISLMMGINNLKLWYAPEVRQFVKVEASSIVSYLAFQVVAVDRPLPAPLLVALVEPKEQSRSTADRLTLTGKVTSGKGVAKVTVTLNGQEVSRQEEQASPKPEVSLQIPLTLQEGKNVLLVTTTDAEGTTQQEARVFYYDRPAPAPSPVAPPPVVAAPPPIPLQIAIASPKDQLQLVQETVALAALVSGGRGTTRVVVTLNGREVSRQEERTPQESVAINLPLTLQEGHNTLVVIATEAGGRLHQEVRTVHYERPVPLTLAVQYPPDQARVTEASTVVAAQASSSKGVARVRVTLNGVEVHQQTERTPQKSLVVTTPVTLREGPNAIVVSASEPDGTARQEVRTVHYEPPKVAAPPALPPPPPLPTSDRWAVVVGVSRYESPDIPRLRYTVPDAEAIYEILTGPAGFKPEHVFLMTDKTDRKPNLRNLKWALGTFLARSAQKDDMVLIFFAGHGAPEVDQRGIERDGLAKYLIPADADPDDLYSTALPMDELQTIFGRIEAERVVVFLDACYSGAAGGRTFASKKTRAVNVDDLFLERLTRSKGRAIITASRPAEVSIEMPELGHGLFTYYLVRGLQGAADLNRDGIVSLQELYEYVEQQVSQKARAVGGNQHPVMKGELEGVLPLMKVR